MNIILKGNKVCVTGGESMIGSNICKSLEKRGVIVDPVPHEVCNLMNKHEWIGRIARIRPDYIIHAAGYNGGIEFNRLYPAEVYYNTAIMALNVLNACIIHNSGMMAVKSNTVKKVVSIVSSCSYPDLPKGEFHEVDIWDGKPHDSIECHGLSKRILLEYSRQVFKQYQISCVCCILNNSYGPGDSFDLQRTKAVAALIKKIVEAKEANYEKVTFWGTGKPLRDFVYCADAGEAIVQILEKYDDSFEPINIGSGHETSIKELTEIIAKEVGYTGKIEWDTLKQDGQMRKKLNIDKMNQLLMFPRTNIIDGIHQTVEWYLKNRN